MNTLIERANKIQAEGIFLGGRIEHFEIAGRKLLLTLLSQGLTPDSKVLDIGCGCLRGGYWLIHFLDQGCYFGIEPNVAMLEAGIRILLEPGLFDIKKPRFDHNPDFDFTVFGEKFDFLVALSIWTHASKPQIQAMLDGFVSTSNPTGILIATYYRVTLFKRDYRGQQWIGQSHQSNTRGMVHHSLAWIQAECDHRGLVAEEINEKAYKYWNQTWLRIKHKVR